MAAVADSAAAASYARSVLAASGNAATLVVHLADAAVIGGPGALKELWVQLSTWHDQRPPSPTLVAWLVPAQAGNPDSSSACASVWPAHILGGLTAPTLHLTLGESSAVGCLLVIGLNVPPDVMRPYADWDAGAF